MRSGDLFLFTDTVIPQSILLLHPLLDGLARGGSGKTAQRRFPQLHRHPGTYLTHAVNNLVHRDAALDTGQRHIRAAHRVDRTHHIPLHAGDLHQSRHRVAHKAHQILQCHGRGMADLLAVAAPERGQRPCRHGGGGADLRLTAAGRTGNAGPEADDRADAGGGIQRLQDFLLCGLPGLIQRPQAPAVGAATIFLMQALHSPTLRAVAMTSCT